MFGVWSDEEDGAVSAGPRRLRLRKVRPIKVSHLEVEVSNSLSSRASPEAEKDKEKDKDKDKSKEKQPRKYVSYAEQMSSQFEEAKTRVRTRRKEAQRAAEEEEAARAEERQAKYLAKKKKAQEKRRKHEALLKEDAKKRVAQAKAEAEQRKEEKVLNDIAAIHAARLRLKVAGSRFAADEQMLQRLLDRIAGRRVRPLRLSKEVEQEVVDKLDSHALRRIFVDGAARISRRDADFVDGTAGESRHDDGFVDRPAGKGMLDDRTLSSLREDHHYDRVSISLTSSDTGRARRDDGVRPRIVYEETARRMRGGAWQLSGVIADEDAMSFGGGHDDEEPVHDSGENLQDDPEVDQFHDDALLESLLFAVKPLGSFGMLTPEVAADDNKLRQYLRDTIAEQERSDDEAMRFLLSREDRRRHEERSDDEAMRHIILEADRRKQEETSDDEAMRAVIAEGDRREKMRPFRSFQEASDDEGLRALMAEQEIQERSDDEAMHNILLEGDRRKQQAREDTLYRIRLEADRRKQEAMLQSLLDNRRKQEATSDDEALKELLGNQLLDEQEDKLVSAHSTKLSEREQKRRAKDEATMRRIFARLGKTYPPTSPATKKDDRVAKQVFAQSDSMAARQQQEKPAQEGELSSTKNQHSPEHSEAEQKSETKDEATMRRVFARLGQTYPPPAPAAKKEKLASAGGQQSTEASEAEQVSKTKEQDAAAVVAPPAPQELVSPLMIQEGDELMLSTVAPTQTDPWPPQRQVPPLPPPLQGEQQPLMLPGLDRSRQQVPRRAQEAHDDEVMQQLLGLGGPSPLNRSSDLQAMGDETLLRKLSSPDFHLPPRTSADDSALRLDVLSEALALGPPSVDPTPKPGRDDQPPMFGTLPRPPDELDMSSALSTGHRRQAAEDDQAIFRLLQEDEVPKPAGGSLQQPQPQPPQPQQQPPPAPVGLGGAARSSLQSSGPPKASLSGDDQLLQRLLETSSAQGIGAHFEQFVPQAKPPSGSGRRARLGHNVSSSASAFASESLPTFGLPDGCRASSGSSSSKDARQSQKQSEDDARLRDLME